MRLATIIWTVALGSIGVLLPHGVTFAAMRCEARKLKAAGAYTACRLDIVADAARTESLTLDPQRCAGGLARKWAQAEQQPGAGCTHSDRAAMEAALTQCAEGVVNALAGGPFPVLRGGMPGPRPSRAGRPGAAPCTVRRLQVAGRYHACRLRAYARAVTTSRAAPDMQRCDAQFARHWDLIETSLAEGCAGAVDQAAVQALVARVTDDVAAALAGGALPQCDAATDWPMSNRDPRNSRANPIEVRLAPDSVARLAPRWRVDGLSAVTGTPAIVDGVVYFGDWSGVLHARRASDGTELWRRSFGSAIRPAPLVARDRVYVAESVGLLHAVDRTTGDTVWSVPLDSQPFLSIDSSPILAGNTIVIGIASFEQVIRKPDYTFRGNIVGIDAETGAERWRVYTARNDSSSGAGVSVWSSAAVDYARKLVFIGTAQSYEHPASPRSDALIAIHYETGTVAWVRQFTAGDVFTVSSGGIGPDADVGASPNLFTIDGRDVVGVGQKNGVYHVLDRATGDVVWERTLTPGSPLGGIMVTAAVDDGVIYVNSNTWRVFGIFTGTNSPLDTSVTFALDARTGTVLWEKAMPAPMFGAMSVANGVVYQGTIDGTVHALAAADGTTLWTDRPGGGIAGGVSIADGTLFVGRGFWFASPPATPNGGFVAYALPADHWVGTWSTSPLCFAAATILGLPSSTRFDHETLRMIVRTSLGGDTVRVRLTNGCGATPLRIGAATVGIREAGPRVRAGTDRTLAFGGEPGVTIPAGATVTSDPVALTLPALSDLAVSLYLPEPTLPGTSHPQAATGYRSIPGDRTADVAGRFFFDTMRQWFFLDAVDVLVRNDAAAIVAFGDSIIDGAGTTYDANARWPDVLARRLAIAGKPFGVLNQGINGNRVLTSLLGESALERFDRDVLGQAGVRWVILLEGINDIGLGLPNVTADDVTAGYRILVQRAHMAGLRIYGGTLTPAKDTTIPFYAAYEEAKRQAVNAFIRESGVFDAVIDFDAVVRDPNDPEHWRPGFSDDGLHPSDAGAAAMGEAIDLALFP